MIALFLALQAVSPTAPPVLGAIGRQALPAHGCAAFLWSASDRALVAMATSEPGRLRLAVDGAQPTDLEQSGVEGAGALGFAAVTHYRGGDFSATLDMTIVRRDDISAGATVPQATLRVERPGRDALVLPVAGLIGCAG